MSGDDLLRQYFSDPNRQRAPAAVTTLCLRDMYSALGGVFGQEEDVTGPELLVRIAKYLREAPTVLRESMMEFEMVARTFLTLSARIENAQGMSHIGISHDEFVALCSANVVLEAACDGYRVVAAEQADSQHVNFMNALYAYDTLATANVLEDFSTHMTGFVQGMKQSMITRGIEPPLP